MAAAAFASAASVSGGSASRIATRAISSGLLITGGACPLAVPIFANRQQAAPRSSARQRHVSCILSPSQAVFSFRAAKAAATKALNSPARVLPSPPSPLPRRGRGEDGVAGGRLGALVAAA